MKKKMLLNQEIGHAADDEFGYEDGIPLGEMEVHLKKLIAEWWCSEDGECWKNIRVRLDIERDYYDPTCCDGILVLTGDRLETDKEVKSRLKKNEKARIRREKNKEKDARKKAAQAKAEAIQEKRLYENLKKKYETS